MYNKGSSPTLTHVLAHAYGGTAVYGIHVYNGSPTMQDVRIVAATATSKYGVYVEGLSLVTINHSVIIGHYAIYCATGADVYVAGTQLNGTVFEYDLGSVHCAGVFNTGYEFFPSSCP